MPHRYFTEEEKLQVKNAIEQAEKRTSGEIRVHVDRICKEDVLDRAAYVFEKLKMHKTEKRNGVLIYLAVESHSFAIIGDAGINNVVPENFWEQVKEQMIVFFKQGEISKALITGITLAGEQLSKFFPCCHDDINELNNDISFGSN